jgi:hypothetical protein
MAICNECEGDSWEKITPIPPKAIAPEAVLWQCRKCKRLVTIPYGHGYFMSGKSGRVEIRNGEIPPGDVRV